MSISMVTIILTHAASTIKHKLSWKFAILIPNVTDSKGGII